jgi:PhzF family phenazine biosynthesis protein
MFVLVDAFSDKQFAGNPAGVSFVENVPIDSSRMQELAAYFNWSEIAYISKINDSQYNIRWFSPLDEAPLCGHATLAASHVIFSLYGDKINEIEFVYKDGTLQSKILDGFISMSFPMKIVHICEDFPFDVQSLIGVDSYDSVWKDDTVYIIVVKSHDIVASIQPNFFAIKHIDARAIIVTSPGFGEFDFCSRYFAPKVGLFEDPVCGSAHCRLAYYWGQRLRKKNMKAFQLSKRTGILDLEVADNRVLISGKAVVVASFDDTATKLYDCQT